MVNTQSASRREAIKEYKARKPQRGAFAVRSTVSGQVWVGASPSLGSAQNSIWFALRIGSHHDKLLQAEWHAHGEHSFTYEIVETLDEDVTPLAIPDLMKELKITAAARLGARTLL